jgi:HEPN domain-containing protein
MKPETREWLHKADGDYAAAAREQAVADSPNHDAVCFHAQQAAHAVLEEP